MPSPLPSSLQADVEKSVPPKEETVVEVELTSVTSECTHTQTTTSSYLLRPCVSGAKAVLPRHL